MSFNTELVKRLKTGSIKNVLLFGDSFDRKRAPYIVVKPMAGGDRMLYQIIVHMALGTQDQLSVYVLRTLSELLNDSFDVKGSRVTVKSTGAWAGPYVDEDTLAMSRDFYVPIIL